MKWLKFAIKTSKLYGLRIFFQETINYYRRPKDNSELGESKQILKYISGIQGNYIDVGSGRPIKNSNTYDLYKQGWKGFLVDPFDLNIRISRIFRPRDTAICGIVSSSRHPIEFHFFQPYEYSSCDAATLALLQNHKFAKFRYTENFLPLSISSLQSKLSKDYIISIDVEGSELDVINSLKFDDPQLLLICIETGELGTISSDEIFLKMLENGFFAVDKTEKSTLFLNAARYDLNGTLINRI